MHKNRSGRVALAAILGLGFVVIGSPRSGAIELMNGIKGPYRVVKTYSLVTFEYGAWQRNKKGEKKEIMEYKCTPVGDKPTANGAYCYFHVARSLFFDNCTAANTSGEGSVCGVGAAEPMGTPLPDGIGDTYRCEEDSIVKTVSNLLFIPPTCVDEAE